MHDVSGRPRRVRSSHEERVEYLTEVLADTTVDDHGVEQHGLAWWYPQIKQWPTVRSVGSGGSSSAGSSLPLNAEALDFIGGHYWIGEKSQDRCSQADLLDEDNYRHGFEPTVLELDKSVRRALLLLPPEPQPRAADPLQPTPAVVVALEHLLSLVDAIARNDLIYELVRSEAIRLIVRARGMMHGSRFSAGRSQCPHCYEVDSVISDEDRAVCVNPICRDTVGARHCWRIVAVDGEGQQLSDDKQHLAARRIWVEVGEPDIRGRGQVSDEQLSRWADVG